MPVAVASNWLPTFTSDYVWDRLDTEPDSDSDSDSESESKPEPESDYVWDSLDTEPDFDSESESKPGPKKVSLIDGIIQLLPKNVGVIRGHVHVTESKPEPKSKSTPLLMPPCLPGHSLLCIFAAVLCCCAVLLLVI